MTEQVRQIRSARLEQDLAYNIARLTQLARVNMSDVLARLHIAATPEQWEIIQCLAEYPDGLTSSELALCTRKDRTTISRILTGMFHHDFVDKVYRTRDKRSYLLRLTENSRKMLNAFHHATDSALPEVFRALSNAEQEFLLALAQKCRRAAGDL